MTRSYLISLILGHRRNKKLICEIEAESDIDKVRHRNW